jgi:hypothetical protein
MSAKVSAVTFSQRDFTGEIQDIKGWWSGYELSAPPSQELTAKLQSQGV